MKALRKAIWSCIAIAGIVPAPSAADPPKRPNVLFIAIDDLNHWVGYTGRNPQAKTPNIDRLAARGMAFTRAYCAAPVCNPSRTALLSGRRPSTTGVYDNSVYFAPHVPVDQTLPSAFRKAGYFVCGAGKIYHGQVARKEEWEDYFVSKSRLGKEVKAAKKVKRARNAADAADAPDGEMAGKLDVTPLDVADDDMPDYHSVDYAVRQMKRSHDRPFFVACGLVKPHLPFSVPRHYYDMHPLDGIDLPPYREDDLDDIPANGRRLAGLQGDHKAILETGTWKKAIQAYLAAISFCDAMVGRLLDGLDESGHANDTIVILFGDHGWHLGEKHHWRKFALWEEATRAPLIYVVPGVARPAVICERTVDFMTIYPTLCDLCAIAAPAHLEGKSIRPLLQDPKATWPHAAITTHGFQNHAVRTETHRYIRYADGGEELYDEIKDPFEWKNLAADSNLAATKSKLAALMPKRNVDRPPTSRRAE